VLLALSPTDLATNADVVRTVLDATHAVGHASLAIKLHPGQGDWSFVAALMRKHPAGRDAIVLRHEPLKAALADASVVVLHRSSVAIEALAAGRPVIIADVGGERSGADLELRSLNLPVADHADLLADLIRQLSIPTEARAYFSEREVVLRHHIGPVGGSASRVVELMQQTGTTYPRPVPSD
jgi:glycosyltransferase involved in cell wall biosynthesis